LDRYVQLALYPETAGANQEAGDGARGGTNDGARQLVCHRRALAAPSRLVRQETTRLPVLMQLAPAANVAARFPLHLAQMLIAHGVAPDFIAREIAAMAQVNIAKTASRSLLGSMNDFTWCAMGNETTCDIAKLPEISMRLATMPIGGQMKYKSPAYMLKQLVENWTA
jgi:hypothetical protein